MLDDGVGFERTEAGAVFSGHGGSIAVLSCGVHVLGLATVAVLAYAPQGAGGEATLKPVVADLERLLRADGHKVLPTETIVQDAVRERRRGWIAASKLIFFDAIRAELEAGQHELERVELARAEARFTRAEELCRDEVAQPGVASLWAEAAIGRGLALFEQGRREEAERAFRRALALEPASTLTEAHVRPDVVRAFARARTAKGAQILLTVEVGGAELRVDGVRGESPVRVTVGEHLIEARSGSQRAAVLVDLKAAARLELTLAADAKEVTLTGLNERPTVEAVDLLAADLGLDEVLVVAVGEQHGPVLRGAVWRPHCATEPLLARSAASLLSMVTKATCKTPSAALMDGSWVRPEALRVAEPRPEVVVPRVVPPKRKLWWHRPWLWLGVAGVAVIGVGLTAGLVTQKPTYQATIEASAFSR